MFILLSGVQKRRLCPVTWSHVAKCSKEAHVPSLAFSDLVHLKTCGDQDFIGLSSQISNESNNSMNIADISLLPSLSALMDPLIEAEQLNSTAIDT